MRFIFSFIVNALVVLIIAALLSGVEISGFGTALGIALVLGFLAAAAKPILAFISLPVNFLTLGIFVIVIESLVIILISLIVPGFNIKNYWWALIFAFIIAVFNSFLP